jgi:thiol-disulfide isomerase/thioredoxin
MFSSFENSMVLKKFYSIIRENGINLLFFGFLVLVIVNPGAKSWILKQLVSIGLFNAAIKKEKSNEIVPFSFISAEGKTATTGSLKGRVVFINFWASWCPPCRAEMSSINELYKKLKQDERFVFISVNEDDDRSKGREYMENNHFILPVYYREGNVSDKIFKGTLPTTIVIDRESNIVFMHEGIGGYDTGKFLQQLKNLL